MSDNQLARRRVTVTYTQLLNLWEFLNTHRDIAVGYNKSAQAREHSKRMWLMAASILNSGGEGAVKSGPEWSKYWVDFKAKIKKKNRMIRDARSRTGGGPSTVQDLSELEVKFLDILGEDYGSGLPGIQVDPFVRQRENQSTVTPGGSSQPTPSEERNEAIYLEISSISEEAIHLENFIHSGENEVDQHNEPNTASTEASFRSSAQISPPQQPSGPQEPQQLLSRATPVAPQIERNPPQPMPQRPRRRQRLNRPLTAAAARSQLVAASEARAQAELNNSRSIEQGVRVLGEIASILRRIEAK